VIKFLLTIVVALLFAPAALAAAFARRHPTLVAVFRA